MNNEQHVTRRVDHDAAGIDTFGFKASDAPVFIVDWFADWLKDYIDGGVSVEHEQTVLCGFTVLQCRVTDRHMQLWCPDFAGTPVRWVDDLSAAMGLLVTHKYTPESLSLPADVPAMTQTAIVGERFTERPHFMARQAPSTPSDSGWFFGTQQDGVDNQDASKLTVMSLYEVILRLPIVRQFLSLPVDHQVVFTPDTLAVLHNFNEVPIPPDSYLGQILAQDGLA